ncbi:MAG: glutaredoxin [Colwellia sp.]|nr:glutaredoxin [Colwellia sp.]
MKNILLFAFLGFCLVKAWQDFGPVSKVEPLFTESYVAVYGRDSCGFTMRMVKKLQQSQVNYRYFNVDDKIIADQLHSRMEQAGIPTKRYKLPVVDVNGDLSVRPKFSQVMKQW